MAVVEFEKKELEKLVGKKLGDKDYSDVLTMIGCPLEKIDSKKVWYEISPNRPDLYGIEGFARAARNFTGLSKSIPQYTVEKPKTNLVAQKVEARPHVVAAIVRNVNLTEEILLPLIQLQEKLHDTLGRKRKKVAIGIHDLDKVTPPFRYIAANPDTKFVPLEAKSEMSMKDILKKHPKGKGYAHLVEGYSKWPLIIDKNDHVLSFPPIINGNLTKLSENTRNLFIDVTGTSEIAVNQALNILVTSLADRKARIEAVKIGNKTTPKLAPKRMKLDISYANRLLGTNLDKNKVKGLLTKMCIGFDGSSAIVPAYRTDIMHQIDIVEELAIATGYANFEPQLPRVVTVAKRDQLNEFSYFLRKIAIGLGLQEVASMILSNREVQFKKMQLEEEPLCETQNPLTVECTACRKRLLPSMLNVLGNNKHREYPQPIFEIGDVVYPDPSQETGARHERHLAVCISDTVVNYEQIVSVLDTFMMNLGVNYKLTRAENNSFMPGRAAEIFIGTKIGIIGEVHPQVLENFGIEKPVIAFELNLSKLFEKIKD